MIVKFALFEVDDHSFFTKFVMADERNFPCGNVFRRFRRRGVTRSHGIFAVGLKSRSNRFVGLWDVGSWDIKGDSLIFARTLLLAFVLNRRIYATSVFSKPHNYFPLFHKTITINIR